MEVRIGGEIDEEAYGFFGYLTGSGFCAADTRV